MPTCENCKYSWTYTEAFKRFFIISTYMICPNCQEKQYATRKTKNKSVFFIFFLIAIAFGLAFILGASLINVAILFGLFFVYTVLYPFILELQSEEMNI